MTKTICFSLLSAGMMCVAGLAQEKPAAKKSTDPAPMSAPKPAPEMKELRSLIGTWTLEETMEPSPLAPSGGTGTGTNTARSGPGGFTVLMEQRSKGTMGNYLGHGVLTWDPNEKAYKSVWADSMTPGFVIETGHKEGDNVVYTWEMMMQGKKIRFKDVVSQPSPTSYTVTSYMNDGSGEKKAMTFKFTKQEPAAGKK
jgi:hypothetical protein